MVYAIDCKCRGSAASPCGAGLWCRPASIRAGLAQRARIVLRAADGIGTNEIVTRTGLSL
jgi:hypothetical protein